MAAHILVGTKKGAFIYTSDEARERWEISEPLLPGTLPPILSITCAAY